MRRAIPIGVVLVLLWSADIRGYGVLSHEAIVDSAWDASILPILHARYHPSDDALKHARAFAYGGCLIQDLGYYPFSSRFFGDLTHYVRSGDFIRSLIQNARDVNELAFALGALAHYAADNNGHPIAVNRSVALIFPKVSAKYGGRPTYEDDPTAHVRTEFSFDVVQIARGTYVPQAYHDFIGFEVATPVLERAFRETYGLELRDVFNDFEASLGTFRWTLSKAVPKMTKIAWDIKRDDIERLSPGVSRDDYLFTMPRAKYDAEWGTNDRRPNVFERFLGTVVQVLPKIGPLKVLKFEPPTPEAERLFLDSFRVTTDRYRALLSDVARDDLHVDNRNIDTGELTQPGEHRLADRAYEQLLSRLAKAHFSTVTPELKANLLAFFAGSTSVPHDKDSLKAWQEVPANVRALRAARNTLSPERRRN